MRRRQPAAEWPAWATHTAAPPAGHAARPARAAGRGLRGDAVPDRDLPHAATATTATRAGAGRPVRGLDARDALLVIDVQRDFLPGGKLEVPAGALILPALNAWIAIFLARGLPVFASRDWHPAGHRSFRAQGGPWPAHCVERTPGAAFADGLQLPPDVGIVSKGCHVEQDAYSAFADTDLQRRLQAQGLRRLFVAGIAAEYCVLQTVLDARAHGFEVVVAVDAVAALEARAGDGERALAQMQAAGAVLLASPATAAAWVQAAAPSSARASATSPGDISTG